MEAVNDAAVPPRVNPSCPDQPIVKDVACSNAVAGLPPRVIVTLVSFDEVNAAATGSWLVVASVPDVGKVTPVMPVMVNVLANAPRVDKLPASVSVEEPLLMPVPP